MRLTKRGEALVENSVRFLMMIAVAAVGAIVTGGYVMTLALVAIS